jgi:hypothetical protein
MLWGSNPWWSDTQVTHLRAHLTWGWYAVPTVIDANSHLKWPHIFVTMRHLGHHFLKPDDLTDISVSNVLYLVKCADSECWSKELHKTPEMVNMQGSLWCPPNYCTLIRYTVVLFSNPIWSKTVQSALITMQSFTHPCKQWLRWWEERFNNSKMCERSIYGLRIASLTQQNIGVSFHYM